MTRTGPDLAEATEVVVARYQAHGALRPWQDTEAKSGRAASRPGGEPRPDRDAATLTSYRSAEIVAMLDVGRARVFQLLAAPGFPEPVATLSVGKVWLYTDVKKWADGNGRTVHAIPDR